MASQLTSLPASSQTPIALGSSAELLSALLRAVSHDSKSPLLTLSLSAELLAEAPSVERAGIARAGLTNGVRELERMLDAVTMLSRALNRPLDARATPLVEFVGAAANGSGQTHVMVDPRPLTDLIELLTVAGSPLSVHHTAHHAELAATLPVECADLETSPLQALFGSLQRHAGGTVGRLAAAQVQLERCGAQVSVAGGQLRIRVPLAPEAR